jgi:hypothetical protein
MSTNVPLQTITLSSTATSVTFNLIDQTYTDLRIVISGYTTVDDNTYLQFNGSSSGYSTTALYTTGSSSTAFTSLNQTYVSGGGLATSDRGSMVWEIGQYANPAMNKSIISKTSNSGYWQLRSHTWANIAPITSITVGVASGVYAVGTSFSLYGIRAGGTSKAAGGDIVVSDGSYWYHAFLKTGAFTPAIPNLSVDVLVVAGGGGGGGNNGGGGGAGGLCFQSSRSLTSGFSTPVLVGSGGAGAPANTGGTTVGIIGTNSVFDTIVALGGGPSSFGGTTQNGGSGGGAQGKVGGGGGTATQTNSGGATGYGNNGGASSAGGGLYGYDGGGGGGAGAAGANAVYNGGAGTGTGGRGGDGLSGTTVSAIDAMGSATGTGQLVSTHYYYAGGGGGGAVNVGYNGAGGYGGGGAGGVSYPGNSYVASTPGTANTGGGGGGSGADTSPTYWNGGGGGNGGSGIVIVRYAV